MFNHFNRLLSLDVHDKFNHFTRLILNFFLLIVILLFFSSCKKTLLLPSSVIFLEKEEVKLPDGVAANDFWLLAKGRERTLSLLKGTHVIKVFDPVAFGGGGVGIKRSVGDLITPRGTFKIFWRKRSSKFKYFLGINYPTKEYINLALAERRISNNIATQLLKSIYKGELPSQETELGGYLGIHGVGLGSYEIHKLLNWTSGCISLINEEILELYPLTFQGMVVEIQN